MTIKEIKEVVLDIEYTNRDLKNGKGVVEVDDLVLCPQENGVRCTITARANNKIGSFHGTTFYHLSIIEEGYKTLKKKKR